MGHKTRWDTDFGLLPQKFGLQYTLALPLTITARNQPSPRAVTTSLISPEPPSIVANRSNTESDSTFSTTGPDFNIMGPKKGNFVPSKYFDILVDRIGLTAIKMEWRWMDPGRGVRKGQIWLRLIRNGEIIADSRYDSELW